jgi:hypothetical protein
MEEVAAGSEEQSASTQEIAAAAAALADSSRRLTALVASFTLERQAAAPAGPGVRWLDTEPDADAADPLPALAGA